MYSLPFKISIRSGNKSSLVSSIITQNTSAGSANTMETKKANLSSSSNNSSSNPNIILSRSNQNNYNNNFNGESRRYGNKSSNSKVI